jgi:hypothetical protein
MNKLDEKIRMIFGSHLYGTNLPSSDLDYKGIFLPSANDLLLQKPTRNYTIFSKDIPSDKNTKNVDIELFSLQEYLRLLLEGQTIALDMLFAPRRFYINYSNWTPWEEIQDNKIELIHSGISSFAGYCRTQAAKYGIKGSRISTLKKTIEWAKEFPERDRLRQHEENLTALISDLNSNDKDLIKLATLKSNKELYLNICGRTFPLGVTFKYLLSALEDILSEYGQRAKLAESQDGIDWKALMHAVRVSNEALELLKTKTISFPRPEKDLLIKIRKGELAFQEVSEMIESKLVEMEEAKSNSTLNKTPNYRLADEILMRAHKSVII